MIVTFDPADVNFATERSSIYRWLRDDRPAFYDAERQTWLLSRFADVYAAATDPATFSSVTEEAAVMLPMLNQLDAPRHTKLRRMVSRAFTPAGIAMLEDSIRVLARDLLDRLLGCGGGDLIAGFAGPYTSTVIGRMIGIPEARLDDFRNLTDQLLVMDGDTMATAAQIYGAFEQLLCERRAEPRDDLMTALLEVQRDGEISDLEMLGFCFLLVAGGNDTTANLIANGWVLLLEHPDAMAMLASDHGLLPGAIEEMLRLNPPAETHVRNTTCQVSLHGVDIPEQARVQLLWGSANLDEREFERAEEFDVLRRNDRHLSFGHGSHFCLGSSLARLEARVAFEALLDGARGLTLVEPPVRLRSTWAYGYERVELRVQT